MGFIEKIDDLYGRVTNRALRLKPYRPAVVETRAPIVTFTFDDVPDTALTAGATILEAHGVRGTFFIAGGLAGEVRPDQTLIDLEGARELARRGHEIGCHTFAHRPVRSLGAAALAQDLDRNADYLEEVDGRRYRRNFAFPYNAGSIPALTELKGRYRACRSAGEKINRGAVDLGFLDAVEIRQPEAHALSLTARIDDVAREPGWLIFFTHDIAETPTKYGCRPETLDRLVAHALAKGCVVEPLDTALDRLGIAGGAA